MDLDIFSSSQVTPERVLQTSTPRQREAFEPRLKTQRSEDLVMHIKSVEAQSPSVGVVEVHRAHVVDEYLEIEDIRRMDWPVIPADLIRAEHAWDALGWTIATRNPLPRTIQGLTTEWLNKWDSFPKKLTNSFTSSLNFL
ncbi:transposable element Tc1 transposase [Trichonephila clavipes]|nr:transposable element Tc1 transposase [Trichonephila clavipes]